MSCATRHRTVRCGLAIAVLALGLPAASSSTAGAAPRGATRAGASADRHLPRSEVVMVQRLFGVLGYPLGHMPLGGLGVRTRGALSYFQRKYHLPVTGFPDARTIARMRAVAASLTARPTRAPESTRHDLIDRLLPSVPILPLGIALALALAVVALAVDRKAAAET